MPVAQGVAINNMHHDVAPRLPPAVFGGNAKHLNISLCLARANSAAWQMGGQAQAQAQAELKTRGWVWLTLKSGSASRCHLQRHPITSSSFSCRWQLQQFLCSLQPVYCDTYLYCLPPSHPSPLSLSFWTDWNKFNFICSCSVSQRTAAAEQRSPHRLNTKLYFDAYLWEA